MGQRHVTLRDLSVAIFGRKNEGISIGLRSFLSVQGELAGRGESVL